MKKNIIDEDKVFEINQNCKVSMEEYGPNKDRVVTVDNFYMYPDLVRQLALDIPASKNKRIRGNNPAHRVNAFYELTNMAWIFDDLLRRYWPELTVRVSREALINSFQGATFMVNVMQSENLPALTPHIDNPSDNNWACTIYLNTPEECAGGTSFYTKLNDDPPTEYVTDSTDSWELLGIAPMVYNRMVLYIQSVPHTAYVKPGMFTGDLYRLNQQFFI